MTFNVLFIGHSGAGKTTLIKQELPNNEYQKQVNIFGNSLTFQFMELNQENFANKDKLFAQAHIIAICVDISQGTESIDRNIFSSFQLIPSSFIERIHHSNKAQRTALFIVATADTLKLPNGAFDQETFEKGKQFLREAILPAYAKENAPIFITNTEDPYNICQNFEVGEVDYRDAGLANIADIAIENNSKHFLVSAMLTVVLREKLRVISNKPSCIITPQSADYIQEAVSASLSVVAPTYPTHALVQRSFRQDSLVMSFVACKLSPKKLIRITSLLGAGLWSQGMSEGLSRSDSELLVEFRSFSLLTSEEKYTRFTTLYRKNQTVISLPKTFKKNASIAKLNNLYERALKEKRSIKGREIFKCLETHDRDFLMSILKKRKEKDKKNKRVEPNEFEPQKLNGTQSVLLEMVNQMKKFMVHKPNSNPNANSNANTSFTYG